MQKEDIMIIHIENLTQELYTYIRDYLECELPKLVKDAYGKDFKYLETEWMTS